VDAHIKANTIKQYFSALADRQLVLGLGTFSVILRDQISRLCKGAGNLQGQTENNKGIAKIKPFVPADTALAAARLLVKSCQENKSIKGPQNSLALMVFGFLFASRADTLTNVTQEDLTDLNGNLVFYERTRKGKNIQEVRTIVVPIPKCYLAYALSKYKSWLTTMKNLITNSSMFWPFRARNVKASATAVTNLLKEVRSHKVHDGPDYPSHALRRGAAISMNAASVNLHKICKMGAWASPNSVTAYLRDFALLTASDWLGSRYGMLWLVIVINTCHEGENFVYSGSC